jgi:uncharacterized protein YqgC (DUF456 family)
VESLLLMMLGAVLVLLGLIGLVFPAMPGAPLLFGGLLAAAAADDFAYVGTGWLILLAVLALLTYFVDVMAGIFGAKHFGASPRAMVGAGIGAVVGLFFGLPGVLLGPFVGACLGEISVGRKLEHAGRAGIGATIGMAIGAAVKIAIAFSMLGIFAVVRFG